MFITSAYAAELTAAIEPYRISHKGALAVMIAAALIVWLGGMFFTWLQKRKLQREQDEKSEAAKWEKGFGLLGFGPVLKRGSVITTVWN